MERQTSDFRTETPAVEAMAGSMDYEAFCRHRDDSLEYRAHTVIERLGEIGFQVVPKPIQDLNIVLNAEGAEAIKEAAASAGASDLPIVSMTTRPHDAPKRWVLVEVVPSAVSVRQSEDGKVHLVHAKATATVVRWGGMVPGQSREITVETAWSAGEAVIGSATSDAMTLALSQARDAAWGFIDVASAPAEPKPTA